MERPRTTTTTSSTLPTRVIEKKTKSPIEIKINDLYARLESEGYGQGPHKLKMPLERTTFLEDAFKHVMSKSKKELQRNKESGFLSLVIILRKVFLVLIAYSWRKTIFCILKDVCFYSSAPPKKVKTTGKLFFKI